MPPRHVAQNPARDPNRAGFISHRLGLGHLNVSDTNFPIGLCRAGWGFGVSRPNGTGEPRRDPSCRQAQGKRSTDPETVSLQGVSSKLVFQPLPKPAVNDLPLVACTEIEKV
jgi:hypothetical protein